MMSYDDDDLPDDPENPDPSDMDSDDYTITVRCPNCRRFIAEDSEVCPRCGTYLSREDQTSPDPSSDRTWIFIIIIVIILGAFICVWVL